MKTSSKVMAQGMSRASRPLSLRVVFLAALIITFVIGGFAVVVSNLAERPTPQPRITVDFRTMQQFPTAAPIE